MTDNSPIILWFRRDLRLADQRAVTHAAASGRPVIALYILDEFAGGAARWWLHHSLSSLGRDLAMRGNRLVLRRGSAASIIPALLGETGARALVFTRSPDPGVAGRDDGLARDLRAAGIEVAIPGGNLLFPPGSIRTGAGQGFKVFTPFWRACRLAPAPEWPQP
ncbi:deoxyribodipyrimidine photo-lyase, partial [Zavarzinia sp.]|uniref:deoxyribodipyrimidine photo-lyase n=1 Tax=Zavarzinia sp. TaxID=2027920 RepID=UPI003BB6A14F